MNDIRGNVLQNDFEEIQKGGELKKKKERRLCKNGCDRITISEDGICLTCKNNK